MLAGHEFTIKITYIEGGGGADSEGAGLFVEIQN
jgi:hypothetical protein